MRIIKTNKKICLSLCVMACFGLVVFVVQFMMQNSFIAKADGDSISLGYEDLDFGVNYNIDYGDGNLNDAIAGRLVENTENLTPSYESQNVSRAENQGNEDLCWAYSYTSAIEGSLISKGLRNVSNSDLSVKQLDYILSKNGFLDNINNPYYLKLNSTIGLNRNLTNSGNFTQASIISTGKHALISDTNFENNNNQPIYFSEINNQKGDFFPSFYELTTGYLYYSETKPQGNNGVALPIYTRELTISHIKKAIEAYGAVAIATHYNKTNCGYFNNNSYTYIDRTERTNKNVCGTGTGHAITLIGWDDDWEYQDGETTKTGAFIVRDSSNSSIKSNLGIDANDTLTEYYSYDSAITSFFIATNVEENNFDNVLDYTDYIGNYTTNNEKPAGNRLEYNNQNNLTINSNDFIFEFDIGDASQDVKEISFSQRIYMGGAYYRASLIDVADGPNDENTEHPIEKSLIFFYPGQRSIILDSPITVKGKFAIKVSAIIPDTEEIAGNINEYVTSYLSSSCFNKSEEELIKCLYDGNPENNEAGIIPLKNNYMVNDTEKKYNLVTLYTDDVKTVTFKDENNTILSQNEYHYGETITAPNNPTKNNTAQCTYVFTGWNPEYHEGDVVEKGKDYTYTAQYRCDINRYTITFLADDGTSVLQSTEIEYGQTPVYNGTMQDKPNDNEYSYSFTGWNPAIAPVTSNATYTATYGQTPREYTVIFLDDDNHTQIAREQKHWHDLIAPPDDPEKTTTPEYTYTFNGWSPALLPGTYVAGDITYTATYTRNKNRYTIRFENYDSSELQTSEVEYGSTPEYTSALPARQPDKSVSEYTFVGWSSDGGTTLINKDSPIPAVTCETASNCEKTYRAIFSPTYIDYDIIFKNDDGTIIETKTYHYNDEIIIPQAPKKETNNSNRYIFAGWEPSISEGARVEENKTYTARYELYYPIRYVLDGGTNNTDNPDSYTSTSQVILKNPTKNGYTFIGWFENEEFSGKKITGISQGSTGLVTLYAKWEKTEENIQTDNSDPEKAPDENTDNITKTDKIETTADIPEASGGETKESISSKTSENNTNNPAPKNPNTGNDFGKNNNGFFQADLYLGALLIGSIGFIIYLIKGRRKLRRRTKKIMKF